MVAYVMIIIIIIILVFVVVVIVVNFSSLNFPQETTLTRTKSLSTHPNARTLFS